MKHTDKIKEVLELGKSIWDSIFIFNIDFFIEKKPENTVYIET